MKEKYDIKCPFCYTPIENCKEFVKCSKCTVKIKIMYSKNKCHCGNKVIITYRKNNDEMIYCGHCGHIISQRNLVHKNILDERLKFKTKIPVDYLIDLQIDVYEFGKGEKI